MDDIIRFVRQERKKNKYGVVETVKTHSEPIFCEVSDVYAREFHDGGRNGLNPEYRFIIFAGNYNGEDIVEYQGRTYSIYRRYHIPGSDYMELYAERKGGTNGKEGDSGNAGG